ncbi:hypothetical protein Ahy_B01g052859 [Arachis hypogaea]|uniref:Ubiquitin-like protease family profile domain-containing protein n=1 Tax=Arachis hypogaea TaxID=3818 RepID=A0A445AQK5_ARAHY|nr:hypothetical protein Ahy_B01g052859 [Arachis hypogaea]
MCNFLFFKTNSNYSTLTLSLFTFLRPPLALSLPSLVQEELIIDDFIYVPPQNETQQTSNNDCPLEPKKQGVTLSLTSSVIEDLMKNDYVYQVSDKDPTKEQEEQSKETPVVQHSEQEALVDVSVIEEFFKDDNVYEVSDEEQSQEPPVARQSEQETLILSSFDRYVVSIYSMILNQIKVRRYQEQIYIVPLNIVPFVPICNGGHWWLWIADVNKKKFYVLDPINKLPEHIPDSRKKLNKFVGLIISHMRVYAGAEHLMEDGLGEEVEYIQLNGQRTK